MKTRIALAVVNVVFAGVCLNGVSNLDAAPGDIIKDGWSAASVSTYSSDTSKSTASNSGVTGAAKEVYSFWYAKD